MQGAGYRVQGLAHHWGLLRGEQLLHGRNPLGHGSVERRCADLRHLLLIRILEAAAEELQSQLTPFHLLHQGLLDKQGHCARQVDHELPADVRDVGGLHQALIHRSADLRGAEAVQRGDRA